MNSDVTEVNILVKQVNDFFFNKKYSLDQQGLHIIHRWERLKMRGSESK